MVVDKKIVFLNIYQNLTSRGGEVFVNEISSNLSHNYQIYVFGGNKKRQKRWPLLWRLYLDPDGISVLWFTLTRLLGIAKVNLDVIVPLNGGWQSIIIRIFTLLTGKKMVVVGQSGIGWDDRISLYCFPDRFVAISSKAQAWAKKVNPFVSSVYIPNGVDIKKFTQIGTKFKHSLKHPVILCVGALVAQKRIDLVIKAVSRTDASLLIVGEGGLKNELEKLADHLLHGRHEFVSMKHSDMPNIYRSADIFTLVPETSEAFGIVYAEAMASNLPVVAMDDLQRREIVGEAGLFVTAPEQLDIYANALKEALARKWGNKPRFQSEKFSWDDIAQKYFKLFNNLT